MHQVQIRSLASQTWTELPYMVPDEEIDLLIALWPPAWKKGLPSTPTSVTDEPRGNPPQ